LAAASQRTCLQPPFGATASRPATRAARSTDRPGRRGRIYENRRQALSTSGSRQGTRAASRARAGNARATRRRRALVRASCTRSSSTPRHRRGSEAPLRRLREIPTEGNTGLLNLKDQHPPATVDRDPADYRAAEERLFPPGLGALLIRARLSRRFYAAREEAYSGSASCGCSSAAAGARACTRTAASTAPRAANAAAARNAAWYPPLSDATSP
jgi:hypothetical protein